MTDPRKLRSAVLLVESIVFTVMVPGTVSVVLPWMIVRGSVIPNPWSGPQYGALLLVSAGVAIYLRCLWDFVSKGRGIPLPIDHPRHLVVRGLYRWVRNPMYLGVLFVLTGEVVFLQSGALLIYTATWFLIVHAVVVVYEEPNLRSRFGAEYDRYAASVRRWLPGRPRDRPPAE